MARYEQLKAAIADIIKTNGREEITGQYNFTITA